MAMTSLSEFKDNSKNKTDRNPKANWATGTSLEQRAE